MSDCLKQTFLVGHVGAVGVAVAAPRGQVAALVAGQHGRRARAALLVRHVAALVVAVAAPRVRDAAPVAARELLLHSAITTKIGFELFHLIIGSNIRIALLHIHI